MKGLLVKNNHNGKCKIIHSEDLSKGKLWESYIFYNFNTEGKYKAEVVDDI